MAKRLCAVLAVLLLGSTFASAGAEERPIGDTKVFAHVGEPGMPEGIAVRDGIVYVGTHTSVRGNSNTGPSKIFKYDLDDGSLLGEIAIQGQAQDKTHGILAMAFDAAGRLYVIDRNPPRVVRLDLEAGTQETYGTFPDLLPCAVSASPCSPGVFSVEAAFPDYLAFDRAGNMYVTDLQASTIFRVPPGGGEAELWFQDTRFDSIFGLNGIAVSPDGTRLVFAMTGSLQPGSPAGGVIYSLPITDAPVAADLQTHFTYVEPASGPDGIAFGASGKLYVALAGSNQMSIVDLATGAEQRFPDAVGNATATTPYDLPASIAFDEKGSALLTNQSFFAANAANWVVFDVFVDDTALPLVEPEIE